MNKFIFGLGAAIAIPSIGFTGTTLYLYPDLRYNPHQFHLAFMRVFRVIKAGSKMAVTYLTKPNQDMEEKHYQSAKELRSAFQNNTGLYIKFGQIIASLDFIIPEPYRKTFEVMCVENIATPYEKIKQQIESSTGKSMNQLFVEFNETPISSASIAQVHRAVLHDGRQVAVKVQHPWLKEQMEGDISLIEIFVDVAERIFSGFKYKWLGEELRVNLPKELDFRMEVSNAQSIKRQMKHMKNIKIPDMYTEYCNDKIIIMEYIDGVPLLKVLQGEVKGYDYQKIAEMLSKAFAYQIFTLGFVHSDPHQGNIMVRMHKGHQQVVLLDHGLYTILDDQLKLSYSLLWRGLLEQNLEDIKKATAQLGASDNYKLFAAMVTSKRFSDLMSDSQSMEERLRRPKDQDQIDVLIKKAAKKHKQITILLNTINRKLLMLFKINDFLKNIDTRLGNPINTYQITVIIYILNKYEHVSDNMYDYEMSNRNILIRMLYRSRRYLHNMKFILLKYYMRLVGVV